VDVALVAEVGADRDRAPAVGFDRRDGVVDRARQSLVEDLLSARHDRHRLADAAAGAGDDGDAVVEATARTLAHGTVWCREPSADAGSALTRSGRRGN